MCVAPLTVDALEVQEVGPAVHLVQLQAHFHQVSRHGVLLTHSQVVRVHHLQHTDTHCLCVVDSVRLCVFVCVYSSTMLKPHPATFQSKLSCLMALYTSAMMS